MKFILCTLFLIPFVSTGQIICTYAGIGTTGTIESGYANTVPCAPLDVMTDSIGDVYFTGGASVYKIDTSGYETRFAGVFGSITSGGDGGPASLANLNFPTALAIDRQGNIYIAETYGAKVRKINTSGIISTIAGNGTPGFSGDGGLALVAELHEPRSIAVDSKGNVYVGDSYNHRVRKIDTNGIITTVAGNGYAGYYGDGISASACTIGGGMYGMFIDDSDNIYLPDNFCVRKITTDGIIHTIAGSPTSSGYSGDGGPALLAHFNALYDVTVDHHANIYVADFYSNNVRKIDSTGIISTVAGEDTAGYNGDGELSSVALLHMPYGIATGPTGKLFICDIMNYRMRIVEVPEIAISTSADTICSGVLTRFTAAGKNVCDAHYKWTVNSWPAGTDSSVLLINTLVTGDTVSCTLVTSPDDTVVALSNSIVISTVPSPNANISSDSVVCQDAVINFTVVDTGGIWYLTNNKAIMSGLLLTGHTAGRDTVTYTVSNTWCAVTDSFIVTVLDSTLCSSGINEMANTSGAVNVYPSPVHDLLNISATYQVKSVLISTIDGRTIYSKTYDKEDIVIDVSVIPAGLYLLRINESDVRKFVKY